GKRLPVHSFLFWLLPEHAEAGCAPPAPGWWHLATAPPGVPERIVEKAPASASSPPLARPAQKIAAVFPVPAAAYVGGMPARVIASFQRPSVCPGHRATLCAQSTASGNRAVCPLAAQFAPVHACA